MSHRRNTRPIRSTGAGSHQLAARTDDYPLPSAFT
jgi:hypothetical protein